MEGIGRPQSVRSGLFSPLFSLTMALNSSALYAGHTLNDYLFKGPDFLNNLVDVVIQFCENLIAKMYHMIAIPEDEQRVHRFLWRKFEVKRQLDTYIKNVSFGGRPAPTTAIKAMRKTGKMKEDEKPMAAKPILKNAQVHDMCDSVKNAEEANQHMNTGSRLNPRNRWFPS